MSSVAKPISLDELPLACFYHAMNPDRYSKAPCNGTYFKNFSKLDEHTKMVHYHQCPDCTVVFEQINDVERHQSSDCGESWKTVEHLTNTQWNKLERLGRVSTRYSREEKWNDAFEIIFGEKLQIVPYMVTDAQLHQLILERPRWVLDRLGPDFWSSTTVYWPPTDFLLQNDPQTFFTRFLGFLPMVRCGKFSPPGSNDRAD